MVVGCSGGGRKRNLSNSIFSGHVLITSISALLSDIDRMVEGDQVAMRFLFPATATSLAALRRRNMKPPIQLNGDGLSYADTIGLLDVLEDRKSDRQPVVGNTYSPLIELSSHAEVDACNAAINELIRRQLDAYPALAGHACQLVGELHDNVPSHAKGPGFSMAQFYPRAGELDIAVADAGQGMLRNVRRRLGQVRDDQTAIAWCMEQGHTTADPPDEWAQRLPEDALHNPLSGGPTRTTDNHHAGLGLWKLEQIATAAGGAFVVWSGCGRLRMENGERHFEAAPPWPGVVVLLRLPIASNAVLARRSELAHLEDLANRLNL